jgi:NADP-dependent 3-hydroxy acid dehydrogenase YdfG
VYPVSKLAVVTGASRGIGASVARLLAEEGLGVLMLARSAQALGEVAGYIQSEGGFAIPLPADLTKEDDLNQIVHYVESFDGDLSVVVHNAGYAKVGKVSDFSFEEWDKIINLNLSVPFRITQKLLPKMKSGGQFIFINSVAGKTTFPEWSAYCASKFGLKAFADALRQEVRGSGIRVTTIYPSSVDTSLYDTLPYDWDRTKMLKSTDVAKSVMYCLRQPANITVNELDLENSTGTF